MPRLAALRGGATVRKISLFERVETVTVEQIHDEPEQGDAADPTQTPSGGETEAA